jgi:hypothetical protein
MLHARSLHAHVDEFTHEFSIGLRRTLTVSTRSTTACHHKCLQAVLVLRVKHLCVCCIVCRAEAEQQAGACPCDSV